MRNDRERLLDMLEAIEAVNRYAAKGRTAFDNDELIQKKQRTDPDSAVPAGV